jgi:hypothetical protein
VKIYIAGALGDEARVRRLMTRIAAQGHEVTFDWTVDQPGEGEEEQRTSARLMRQAVLACDAFVLVDHSLVRGALIELGMAVGAGKPALICTPVRASVFFWLPGVQSFDCEDDLEGALRSIA